MIRLRNFFRLRSTKDVIINTGGNYLSFFFAGIYILLFVRVFPPEQFGILSVLLALSYLLANILSFGMPAAIYAHIPELIHDRKKALSFAKTNFLLLTALSFVSLLIIFMFVDFLDGAILKLGAPRHLYALALVGTALYIWQNYIRDILNAAQKFLHINIAINVSNVIKTVLLIGLFLTHQLTIETTLFTLGIIGPMIVFAIVLAERRWIIGSLVSSPVDRSSLKLGYTLTYFIATQLFSLATRVDLFMISYFLSSAEVGYYGLSQRIILAIVTSSDSITQVLSPQFAQAKNRRDVTSLIKRSFTYMLLPAVLFALAVAAPSFLYELFFTTSFESSTHVTRLLSFAYIPYGFLAVIMLFFLYTIKKPVHLLVANGLFLAVLLVGNYVFIPVYGLLGPPLAFVIAFTVIAFYIVFAFWRELQCLGKHEKN